MEGVYQDLAPLARKGKVEGFLNNAENARKLGELIEDVRDVTVEYQVCTHDPSVSNTSDVVPGFVAARYLRQE